MDETYLRVRSAGSQGSFLTSILKRCCRRVPFSGASLCRIWKYPLRKRAGEKGARVLFSVPSAVNLFPCPGRGGGRPLRCYSRKGRRSRDDPLRQ